MVTSWLLARQDLLDAVEHFRSDDRLEVAANIYLPVLLDDTPRVDRAFQDPSKCFGSKRFALPSAKAVLG